MARAERRRICRKDGLRLMRIVLSIKLQFLFCFPDTGPGVVWQLTVLMCRRSSRVVLQVVGIPGVPVIGVLGWSGIRVYWVSLLLAGKFLESSSLNVSQTKHPSWCTGGKPRNRRRC